MQTAGVARGSIWLDLYSVEEKQKKMECRNPGIFYFSLKKKWKQVQKVRNMPFFLDTAKENGYNVVGYFMESKIKVCIERNALREGKACVPMVAIASTSKKLEMPSYDEGFDVLYFVKNDGENMTILPWRE